MILKTISAKTQTKEQQLKTMLFTQRLTEKVNCDVSTFHLFIEFSNAKVIKPSIYGN